jgi:nitrous oxidase accessory protein
MPWALDAAELHVGAGRDFQELRPALAAARPGDTIVLHGGRYAEAPMVIDKPVALIGVDHPVIDGRGQGDVLTITAAKVMVRGLVIERSGAGSIEDYSGIRVIGVSDVTLEGNRIRDCAFGLYFSKARRCTARDNKILGNLGRGATNGNGIHGWSCEKLEITGNQVRNHRDGIYFEFVTDSRIEANHVADSVRYGLHFMSAHRNRYRDNFFGANGAGVAVMYSREVEMRDNHFAKSWGSAAYGLLLKDISDSIVTGNTFSENSIAVTIQNSSRLEFSRNRFLANGWALQIQASSTHNTYRANNFVGNAFDVAAPPQLEANRFAGNYWDKAETYDLNRDGVGDLPHRPVSLFSMLADRVPPALLLLRSPLAHFLDRAERIFPSVTPDSVRDEHPAMRPLDL